MKSKIFGLLFKQYNLGIWLGASFTQIVNGFVYITVINTFMLSVTVWSTPFASTIVSYIPWFNFWWFLLALFICFGSIILFDLKFVYPARQAFQNKQSYAHENPVKADLERIFKENEKLVEHNKKLDNDNVELKNKLDTIIKYLKIPDLIAEKK